MTSPFLRSTTKISSSRPIFCNAQHRTGIQCQKGHRSGLNFTQSRQEEEGFTGDSRGRGWGGGGGEPDLGGDVELVDEADLLGELLAGVGGQVLAHRLQELRGFEAATVHLSGSGRAGCRISTAE